VRIAGLSDSVASEIAAANCSAVEKRSAGTRASALRTAHSTRSGSASRRPANEGAGPDNRLAIIACTFGPENGGSPAIIS
jgi:hypothetical protein